MTTVDIPKKLHKKLKLEAAKKNMDLQDLVAQKLKVLIVALLIGSFAITSAYAATEVSVFLPINKQWDSDRCVLNVFVEQNKTQFVCSWDWTFSMEAFNFLPDPETPTFEEYEKALIDYLNEIEDKTPAQIVEEFSEPVIPEIPQFMKALQAKKLEAAEDIVRLEALLKDCEAIKERWSKIQDSEHIESLDIPKTMFAIDDYATAGKAGDFNLMFEECRGMIKFQPQIVQYENMIESASVVVDTTPSEQFEIDHEQKQADAAQLKLTEATRWLDWRCQPDQVKIGLCKENLSETARDPNKGGFSYDAEGNIIGTVDCSYYYIMVDVGKRKKIPQRVDFCISDEQKVIDRETVSLESQIEQSKQIMCEEYMPHYAHQDTIPQWLDHCEGYVAPTPEELQQTIQDCPDCDEETMTKEQGVRHCYIAGRGEVDCAKKDADKLAREKDN